MQESLNLENIAMELIANSGQARNDAFTALKYARVGDYAKAKQMLEESDKMLLNAHKAQTSLLTSEARGEVERITLLLVHAQDHLMSTMLAQDLIKEMVNMYQQKADK